MIKKILILNIILILFVLTSCSKSKIENLSRITDSEKSITKITWQKVTYSTFGTGDIAVDGFLGKQIGIVGGDKNDKIFEVNGYDSHEWLIEYYDSGEMDTYDLWKADTVEDIPDKLEKYRLSN